MVKLTFIGHSCVLIANNGTSLLIDPFISKNSMAKPPARLKPTHILVTHAHGDHLGDTIELAKKHDCQVLTTSELANYLRSHGVERVMGAHYGGKVPYDFGWVKLWPAVHSSTAPDGTALGMATSFTISIGGKSIYHAGDTALSQDMALVGDDKQIDIACLPIGGHFTMGIDDAVKACELIKPRVVVPIHYNTFDLIKADPDEFSTKLEKSSSRTKACVLMPGELLELP
ncbi:MAG TPA: metal-dependent hydrolase [Caldisericia bacterium]|nr:metal-dependent hydrolase [Caldisericia bacterium]HPF48293.1 metal-dependent hydrolase [Caldisericia bacterium]HPI83528.1 metal-dependent hydrolase [Caldisericia bacterium]HPQ92746.1 metal-dependent hydrolase [Caldisericia bacterium]HRV74156.1 metal-dependent hydrolase [Caldisericia bacterium]